MVPNQVYYAHMLFNLHYICLKIDFEIGKKLGHLRKFCTCFYFYFVFISNSFKVIASLLD